MNETAKQIIAAKYKIAVLGAAGTGKTTAAEALAQTLGIPFISAPTAQFTEKYGVKTHLEVIRLCSTEPEKGIQLHMDIMKARSKLVQNTEGPWVTDRSCLDTFVYYLMQCSMWDSEDGTDSMFAVAYKEAQVFDVIFGFRAGCLPLQSPHRVQNLHWQRCYELIFKKMILEVRRRMLVIEEPEGAATTTARVDIMTRAIGENSCSRV